MEIAFDAGAAKGGEGEVDALREGGVGLVLVVFCGFGAGVVGVIEPDTVDVAFKAVQGAVVADLDRRQLRQRRRHQHAHLTLLVFLMPAVSVLVLLRGHQVGALDDDDRPHQHHEQQPDDDQAATVHRCFHQTPIPTTARMPGISTMVRKRVPFICRLVRLTRGWS